MSANFLKKIRNLYKKSDELLKSKQFGDGLWPLNADLGYFLAKLIELYDLKNGVEIGAGVGYSTGWLASGFLKSGGRMVSLEYFSPKVKQWEKHMQFLFGGNYEDTVQIVPSDFRKWIRHPGSKKIDFVFLDHRKNEYLESLRLLIPYLKKGAFVCADNVLSHEKGCSDYLAFVRNDPRFRSFCVPSAEGLEVSRYLPV